MTNADRIRAMTDEELAGMFCGGIHGFDCGACREQVLSGGRCNMKCYENCVAWLRQEAAEKNK